MRPQGPGRSPDRSESIPGFLQNTLHCHQLIQAFRKDAHWCLKGPCQPGVLSLPRASPGLLAQGLLGIDPLATETFWVWERCSRPFPCLAEQQGRELWTSCLLPSFDPRALLLAPATNTHMHGPSRRELSPTSQCCSGDEGCGHHILSRAS